MSAERTAGDFGSKLREARERRGVTLRQISNATKISVGQLESLEKNNISKLPGGIFSRAFVRSYALEVGLDPEATIQDFMAQFPHASVTIGHPTSEQVEDTEALESDRRLAGTFLWLLVISIPVAAVVLYFSMSGRTVSTVESAAPSVPTTIERPAPAPTPIAAAEQPTADARVPPAGGSAPASRRTPDEPTAPDAPPAPAASTAAGSVLMVGVSVRRPCWVSASVDGQKVIERLLQVGEQRAFEVHRELVITAGDASAIALTFNGADARLLGRSGEVVTARFNLGNFKNYLQNP